MKRKLSRRVILQGMGATVALPWLESVRALADDANASNDGPPKRFAFLFFGDGIHPPEWWTKGSGAEMELGAAFESLQPLKQKINFVHGLDRKSTRLNSSHIPLSRMPSSA